MLRVCRYNEVYGWGTPVKREILLFGRPRWDNSCSPLVPNKKKCSAKDYERGHATQPDMVISNKCRIGQNRDRLNTYVKGNYLSNN